MSDVSQIPPMASSSPAQPRKIALVGYHGVQALDLVGPWEVFSMANNFGGTHAYEPIMASPAGGDIVSNSGLVLAGSTALADLPDDLDTVLVGGGDEAGLLDGRRATTHWGVCDVMRDLRPAVHLEPDAIFVADPPFYTSAGVTAGIDLCLPFVEADLGPEIALAVARNLVLFMRRPGGQTQYSAGLNVQAAATPRLRQLIADIAADPCGDLSVPQLAARAAMSERTFSRVFQKETGIGPAAFVESARLDRA